MPSLKKSQTNTPIVPNNWAANIRLIKKGYERDCKVPTELNASIAEVTSKAHGIWASARQNENVPEYLPILAEIIKLKIEKASALTEGGRQSMTISMRRFDARRLGALIALFERAVGLYGELVNINAYHQPGVEAGKKAAAAILDLQGRVEAILADGVARSADEIRLALGDGTDESIFWILRHLTGNQRGFSAQGDWSQPASMRFSKG